MDHFPSVKHPYRPVRIRYMPTVCYDDRGFYDFPDRRGWTSDKIESAHADGSPLKRNAAAFLQSWLYFGTLREVMGIPILMSDYVRHDRGRLWVTTERLPAYIQDWGDSVASSSLEEERDRLRKTKECLCAVARSVNDLAGRQNINGTSRLLAPEHALSIAILVFTLNDAGEMVFRRSDINAHPGYIFNEETAYLQFLRSRFTVSCPSLFDRLVKRLHFTGLYFASLLAPSPISEDHGECTEKDCAVEKIDTKTYSTAHSHPECNCEHVHMSWRELLPLVFFNMIPLVSLEDGPDGLHLKVVPFENHVETPYVTISHVWSHGLGNPQANSLPQCQLRALQQRIMESDPQRLRYFWIDTLCVPLEPPEARKRAIGKMKDIYGSSELVLVLDTELVVSTKDCELEEVLMRINLSRWLTRLWTFQEAVLARRLVFQFSEGPVDIHSFKTEIQQRSHRETPGRSDVMYQAIEFWLCFRQLRLSSTSPAKKFGLLCRDVGWRSTSRAEDESICYAGILGMDLQKFLDTDGHHRMQIFWSLQEEVPLALLFEPGPRLQIDGFRWAHSSLLNTRMDDGYKVVIDTNMASVGPEGLTVDCFSFRLNMSVENIGNFNFVRFKHEDTWYIMVDADDMALDDWKNAIALSLSLPVIIILRNEVDDRRHTDGVLAAYRGLQDETQLVRYICRVAVIKSGSYVDSLWNNPMLRNEDGDPKVVGVPTGIKRWCIS